MWPLRSASGTATTATTRPHRASAWPPAPAGTCSRPPNPGSSSTSPSAASSSTGRSRPGPMNPAVARRIPLVCRPRPPATPLSTRIGQLTALTAEPDSADHRQRVARASGVLNFAALIASDTGMPDLAAELCWRQYTIFADAGSLDQDIAVMALMPIVNIARLLIREGDGNSAYELLRQLYRAAQQRGTTTIRG